MPSRTSRTSRAGSERVPPPPPAPLRLGVSSCLLGQQVRHDGGHKRDAFLVDILGRYVDWVPVCPEVEMGMPTPRPAIRLVEQGEEIRLREVRGERDHTSAMRRFASARLRDLGELSGYVLKKGSPSCGMERVRLWSAHTSQAKRSGRGLFAQQLMERYPLLPVEEEGRLHDARLRENFVERIFAHERLRGVFSPRWKLADLQAFHAAHKLQLMAHSPRRQRELGRLIANAKQLPRRELQSTYAQGFMQTLAIHATPRRHVNVLQHMLGYLRRQLDGARRRDIDALIQDHGAGLVPLVVPVTLLAHYVRFYEVEYLQGQTYLEPHPRELMLRNHV